MEHETEDETYTSYVAISWRGYDKKNHMRIIPEEWKSQYLRATKKMTPDQGSVLVTEVY
jgi:hypothetical protein